jgi:DNA-binding NtrC family response regulator
MANNEKNIQILVVDDESTFHQDFHERFSKHFSSDKALSSRQMWDKLQQNSNISLILLGLNLDGISVNSGLQLIPELKKEYPLIPIAAMSREDNARTIMYALRVGAKTFISKREKDDAYWIKELNQVMRSNAPLEQPERKDKNYSLLVVDDDRRFHKDFRLIFGSAYEIDGVLNDQKMWEKLAENKTSFDLLLLDMKLDGETIESGLRLIPEIKKRYPQLPVVAITADNNSGTVVEAMKIGAKSFLPKNDVNFNYWNEQIIEVIFNSQTKEEVKELTTKVKTLSKQVEVLKKGDAKDKYPFIGQAPRIVEIKNTLQLLAQRPNMTILLTGETGVGKEVSARFYHSCGPRKNKPFVSINLSAISKTLLESALFGSVKGGFTDAQDVVGYFSQANGGILMLDEIGEIDHDIQVKLLRFFEQRIIRPVGSAQDIEVDVQIITATNKNINQEVANGKFRDDLRYRLNFTVEIPPLRERKEDILPILEHYTTEKFGVSTEQSIENAVIGRIKEYAWPGNIRQLCNLVEGMMIWKDLLGKEKADIQCFEEALKSTLAMAGPTVLPVMPVAPVPNMNGVPNGHLPPKKAKALEDLTKIEQLLGEGKYNKSDVAEILKYKGTDHLRSRIRVCYANYPELFEQLPNILQHYPL